MKEIGSEFEWQESSGNPIGFAWLPKCDDWCLTFSGRTAFESVIKDIGIIKKVYFPSYCCDSMLEPFRKEKIGTEFYNVDFEDRFNIRLSIPDDCDVLVWCNYFGYEQEYPTDEMEKFKNRGGKIIEDITHSLLSNRQYNIHSDYIVASVRKWGAVLCGGLCCKLNGKFKAKPQKLPDERFIELKSKAMRLKREYIHKPLSVNKSEFLEMYAESNRFFATDYSDVKMDKESEKLLGCMNFDKIRKVRQKNAAFLHNELCDNNICKTIFDLKNTDCPLFVPVAVFGGKRDELKQELIKNSIYCPSHWPRPKANCDSNLYDIELSLICDQRYTEKDMMRIIDIIKNFRG
ncbi:MAG: hypothetical protein E7473_07685 [Ruminococcaceae bacterium]|nr:hypothetical protein [Oscillospiraceae bacterium]